MSTGWRKRVRQALGPLEPSVVRGYEYVLLKVRYLDPGLKSFRDTTGREAVNPGSFNANPRLAVILAVGASNIANEGDPNGRITPQRDVFNFNFFDGLIYAGRDPLLGATANRSNVLTRVGDRLVQKGVYDRVLLVPIAYGGTYIAEWAPGGRMHPRLARALRKLRKRQIRLTHLLWQQGEAEAAVPKSDPKMWADHFRSIASTVRATFPQCSIYVAQCTVCRNSPNEVIRAAQRSVIDPEQKIFPGPDLDTIEIRERWDQCHFSVAGLERAADLWFEAWQK